MLEGDPKKPHPLSQSFGSVGGKLVQLFCSELIVFVVVAFLPPSLFKFNTFINQRRKQSYCLIRTEECFFLKVAVDSEHQR